MKLNGFHITPDTRVRFKGVRGRFKVNRIDGNTVHVWGGTKGREMFRAFDVTVNKPTVLRASKASKAQTTRTTVAKPKVTRMANPQGLSDRDMDMILAAESADHARTHSLVID